MPFAFISYDCFKDDIEKKYGYEYILNPSSCEPGCDRHEYLTNLVEFTTAVRTLLGFCTGTCVPQREPGMGHLHVCFNVNPSNLESAQNVLHSFMPNMNCEEVRNPDAFQAWMEENCEII